MLQVDANIRARGDTPEGTPQLSIMHPYLDVFSVKKLVQTARVVEMEMSDDDLLDILDLVACCFDSGTQFVLWLVPNASENVGEYWAPYFRVVFPTTCFPEDETFVRVLD